MSMLVNWQSCGVNLPMDWNSFENKITALKRFDKLREIEFQLFQVWECVLYDREVMDIHKAVVQLYDAVNATVLPQLVTPVKTRDDTEDAASEALLTHWNGPFIGPSCRILREMIRRYEKENSEAYYTKSLYSFRAAGRQVTTSRFVRGMLSNG